MQKKYRKNSVKKQKRIIIGSIISIFCLFSVGYAAVGSNFSIRGKGTIIKTAVSESDIAKMVVTSGEGLYKDPVEVKRYVYRGDNPDNYIILDGQTYRIVSFEADGTIKVVKEYNIGCKKFDEQRNISDVANNYCTSNFCNAWGSKSTTLNQSGNNVTQMPREIGGSLYNLPSTEASLNTYLNTIFLDSLSPNLMNAIDNHLFNVGPVQLKEGQELITDISQEQAYRWRGKIGLLTATDYVRADTNVNCNENVWSSKGCQNQQNYLNRTDNYRYLINPFADDVTTYVYGNIDSSSGLEDLSLDAKGVWPSFYLKSTVKLTGAGTIANPYCVEGINCNIAGAEADLMQCKA